MNYKETKKFIKKTASTPIIFPLNLFLYSSIYIISYIFQENQGINGKFSKKLLIFPDLITI